MSSSDRQASVGTVSGVSNDVPPLPLTGQWADAGAQDQAVLQVRALTKRFGGLIAVSSVDFDIARRRVTSIVGPNGAGKTTLFNLISGVTKPDHGTVCFEGRDVTGWPSHRLTYLGLARTFQNVRLFRHLNAIENVMVGRTCRTHAHLGDFLFRVGRDRAERRESVARAEQILDWVGVHHNRFRLPHELPYGDQRRVEIARALAAEPKLLILDEPTQGMVAQEAHAIVQLMGRLTQSGLTLLLIEHNMNVVMSVSDRVIVLNFGEKIAEGSPASIRADDRVVEAYLGSEP
jgi:branched-chain amino acid transport system ATP-binding protein